MKKKDYLKPCTKIVLLTMHNNLLTTSGVEVYKDTETYEDDEQYASLEKALSGIGCRTFRPVIASKADEAAEIGEAIGWRSS